MTEFFLQERGLIAKSVRTGQDKLNPKVKNVSAAG